MSGYLFNQEQIGYVGVLFLQHCLLKDFRTVLRCETSIGLPDTDLIVLQYSNTW